MFHDMQAAVAVLRFLHGETSLEASPAVLALLGAAWKQVCASPLLERARPYARFLQAAVDRIESRLVVVENIPLGTRAHVQRLLARVVREAVPWLRLQVGACKPARPRPC